MPTAATPSLTLIGSSSGRNAGDAAILSGLMDSIDRAYGEQLTYEIPTYRPPYVANEYQNRAVPISMYPWHGTAGMFGVPTYRSMGRTNGTLIFDNMLFDRKLYNPIFNFMSTMAAFLPRAKRQGKVLGCFNVGLGPIATPRGRTMLRDILDLMDFVAVRDQESLQLMRDVGSTNPNVIITADAAIEVRPAPKERIDAIWKNLGFSPGEEVLALNVNTYLNTWTEKKSKAMTADEFAAIYAQAADKVLAKLKVPVLFVCTQHHDISITENVMKRMTAAVPKKLFTNVEHNHYEVKGLLSRVGLLFAMRLHASILASSGFTPVAALAFQKKVSSYYNVIGLPEFALSFDRFTVDGIAEHVLNAWSERAQSRAKLEQRIPQLVQQSMLGAELTARVLRGERADRVIADLTQSTALRAAANR